MTHHDPSDRRTDPGDEPVALTHEDVRAMLREQTTDLKQWTNDKFEFTTDKIDGVNERLDKLNGQTLSHGQQLAEYKTRLISVEKEVFKRRRRDDELPHPPAPPAKKSVLDLDNRKLAALVSGGLIGGYAVVKTIWWIGDILQKVGAR